MKSIEDLKRKERKLSFLLNVFVTVLILIGLFLLGWVISVVYADNSMLIPDTGKIPASLARYLLAPTSPPSSPIL